MPVAMGRSLGLDVGSKTIGVAVSDPLGFTAQAVEVIARRGLKEDLQRVLDLIRQWEVTTLVVGLPLRTDGSRGPEAETVATFARRLEAASGLPVRFQDERFTTRQAQRVLLEADLSRKKRRQGGDKTAAALILQAHLDRCRSTEESRQQGSEEDSGEEVGHTDALDLQQTQADGENEQTTRGRHLRDHGRRE